MKETARIFKDDFARIFGYFDIIHTAHQILWNKKEHRKQKMSRREVTSREDQQKREKGKPGCV
jgi:hypothetical protein